MEEEEELRVAVGTGQWLSSREKERERESLKGRPEYGVPSISDTKQHVTQLLALLMLAVVQDSCHHHTAKSNFILL